MDNFREWVSDNLRYIMLICAIAVVCIGIFFGVRAITGRMSAGNSGAENTGAAAVATGIPAEEIESGASLAESAATLQENKIPEVSGLVTTYYMALNSKNVESVRAISDNLSDQDPSTRISSPILNRDQRRMIRVTWYMRPTSTSIPVST